MKNVMIDIETLGTKPGSVIWQIGGCSFDPTSGEIGEEFKINIDRSSCEAAGLVTDQETIDWWTARGGIQQGEAVSLAKGLSRFADWMTAINPDRVWAWGMDFERKMLGPAFGAIGMSLPWEHWDSMDARTVWNLAFPDRRHSGQAHDALGDCKKQVGEVAEALSELKVHTARYDGPRFQIDDHEIGLAVHELRGFTPDLIEVLQKHRFRSLRVVDENSEAARLLALPGMVPIEQDGKTVLIAEFEGKGDGNDE